MATNDYVSAHLQWIQNNPRFVPKEQPYFKEGYSYYDMMKQLYENQKDLSFIQNYAKVTWQCDIIWHKRSYLLTQEMNKMVDKLEPQPSGMWFVTIGFNHQTWSVSECCKVIEKILGMEWIISAKANFELYRENGEHPHCHFVIKTKEPKSRILDKLFRPQYVKKVILSKNFIDIKPMMEYHLKYINLEKQSDKDIYVNKDREWRKQNNIPDYEKNWVDISA